MSPSNINSMLATCQRLLTDYAHLLICHRDLFEQLTSIQKKQLDSESESHEGLEKPEKQLKGVEQRLHSTEQTPRSRRRASPPQPCHGTRRRSHTRLLLLPRRNIMLRLRQYGVGRSDNSLSVWWQPFVASGKSMSLS